MSEYVWIRRSGSRKGSLAVEFELKDDALFKPTEPENVLHDADVELKCTFLLYAKENFTILSQKGRK